MTPLKRAAYRLRAVLRDPRVWRALVVLAAVLIVVAIAHDAFARPGGGQGYSGGSGPPSGGSSHGGSSPGGGGSSSSSRSSGGSGGGGIGEAVVELLVYIVIELIVSEPRIGIPVLIVVVLVFFLATAWSSVGDWISKRSTQALFRKASEEIDIERRRPPTVKKPQRVRLVEALKRFDPDFSLPIFEDFVQALYTRVHVARGAKTLDELAPYVEEPARRALAERGSPGRVEAVVIGAMEILQVRGIESGASRFEVDIRFETNLTEVSPAGDPQGSWVVETWTMSRSAGAKSRPPARARTFDCPSCGAPLTSERATENKCRSCNQPMLPGEFDWALSAAELERAVDVPPALGHAEERGTDYPTFVSEGVQGRLRDLAGRDPTFSWDDFVSRVKLAFTEINEGWSTRTWSRARPFVSDMMFQTQRYFLAAYERAGKRNVVDGARIYQMELVELQRDRYYDAITVRIFAAGYDYTVWEADETVVSGSQTEERTWSEYWTFIRSASVSGRGASPSEKACPQCGAALEIEMSGTCKYCRAHVTSGEFGWVLSRIEQDDAYAGQVGHSAIGG